MRGNRGTARLAVLLAVLGTASLQGCTGQPPSAQARIEQTAAASDERTCLIRAMYLESNRSSRDGLMAVGTVSMVDARDAMLAADMIRFGGANQN